MLADNLTVLENVVLGSEPSKAGFLDFTAARAGIKKISDTYRKAVNMIPGLAILNSTTEIGTKWDFLRERLSVSGSYFATEKDRKSVV